MKLRTVNKGFRYYIVTWLGHIYGLALDLLNYIALYMCTENFGLTFLDQSRAACISVNNCSGDSFNELIISALDLLLFDSNGT